ncbi:putative C6 transcription factor [Hypoxylon sp. FL1150]|nr:putative C6 transcription factor [Hypoxylon sp. FL1150]
MHQSPGAEPLGRDGDFGFSCLACRQRKVKCDRRPNCSNCTKALKQCVFVAPVRGKRKRTKPRRESLHAKLKRYEELLESYGANVELSEDFDESDSDPETASRPDAEMDEGVKPSSRSQGDPFRLEDTKPQLVTKEGTSRYYDNALWSNLGDQFQHPEITSLGEPLDETDDHEGGMLFEADQHYKIEDLRSLHPPFQILPKLRDIYADRADSFIKVLHLPTFWAALTNGLRNPQGPSKPLEAEIFAFYLATVSSLKEDECLSLFGMPKPVLYNRYRFATRQALVNAGFLSTSSPTTLRAYAIFIMCLRKSHGADTLYIFSGVAVRLARKMGLHRDGTSLGLSPFETEMRRRLWWHLAHMDFRLAEVLGARPSLDLSCGDTKKPLNVDDEDLHPDMVDPPAERDSITPMAPCLIKCEVVEVLRKFSSTPGDVRWESLYTPDVSLAKKDAAIAEVQDLWERRFLRYCDPSEPFHTFVSLMVRSSICKMKLFAHSLRRFASGSRPPAAKIPRSERDIVFDNATKLLEYVTLTYEGGHGLEKYMWQIGTSYLWNTVLYVLIEARHRKTGPKVDRLWQLIGAVFSHYHRVLEEPTGAVYTALGKWTLEVWDHHVAAAQSEGLPEPPTPDYIDTIRQRQKPASASMPKPQGQIADLRPGTRKSLGYGQAKFQPEMYDGGLPELEPLESYDFPDLLSFEMDPNEWVQWEQLVAGQNGFAPVGGM